MPELKILHTEASSGWGGQEMRILREAIGMRKLGYSIIFAVIEGGELLEHARNCGFKAYGIPFKKSKWKSFWDLRALIRKEKIDLVNTHSSMDAWIGGFAAKSFGLKVIRTRHISSVIRGGLNAFLLYKKLSDFVVTTCGETAQMICDLACLPSDLCRCIPTGIDPTHLGVDQTVVQEFRNTYGIRPTDCLIGTLCVLRRWKGISEFLKAALLLRHEKNIKWMIIGSGPSEEKFRLECRELGLEDSVIFTGYLDPPYTALAALDVFCLLSTANEGISQATLQAAYLAKPMITTTVGGLKEVCLDGQTGYHVPSFAPEQVANKVLELVQNPFLRARMGIEAKMLVEKKFTFDKTLLEMETAYASLFPKVELKRKE